MTRFKKRGIFITFEGIDGTGKSTQHGLLVKRLRALGHAVCSTREPGGTRVGEQIRRILLSSLTRRSGTGRGDARPEARSAPTALAELVLMYAARAQHLEEVIRPALARGLVVVSDRFNDASLAYQGYGRGLGVQLVRRLDQIICGPTQPDLTLLLDLDPRRSLERAQRREARRKSARGRFEKEGFKFHARVRAGYLALARREPQRIKVVRTDRDAAEVQSEIRRLVETYLIRTKP